MNPTALLTSALMLNPVAVGEVTVGTAMPVAALV